MARTIATNTSEKKKLDAAELAVEYGITKHTVYRLARAGQIPCVRIGRSLRFDRDAVAAHLTRGGAA